MLKEVDRLPDVAGLPDVARVYAMARVGRGKVGSEKTTGPREMPRSPEPEPEVAGQPRWSQNMGCPD